jgi:hypothetical protein
MHKIQWSEMTAIGSRETRLDEIGSIEDGVIELRTGQVSVSQIGIGNQGETKPNLSGKLPHISP